MADAQILYASAFAQTITTSGPIYGTGTSIAGSSFTANTDYLILAWAYVETTSTANEMLLRLQQGGATVTDGEAKFEANALSPDHKPMIGFVRKITQGATPGTVALDMGNFSTNDTTADLFILAFNLTDLGSDGTDWHFNEVTADYTSTTSYVDKALVTFTPNGTDDWLIFGDSILLPGSSSANHQVQLNDSVAGALQTIDAEGEDVANEIRSYVLGTVVTPTNASHTFSMQQKHETTASTVYGSRIFALNLSTFAQHSFVRTAALETPATAASWTTTATVSPTPDATGDWIVLGFLSVDMNSVSTATDGLRTRLQINPAGGGLASDPAYGDDAPEMYSWDATDITPMLIGTKASLTSGASRAINLDVSQQATVIQVLERTLVAFSVALAGAADPTGTAASTFTFSTSATGSEDIPGTAASSFAFSTSVTATEDIPGTAASSFSFSTAATGAEDVPGTAASTFTFSTSITAEEDIPGAAASTFTFSTAGEGSSDSSTPVTGTAASTFAFSASATASEDIPGTAASTFTFSASATADEDIPGTAASTFTFSTSVTATEDIPGTGASTFLFSASAEGTVDTPIAGEAASTFLFSTSATAEEDIPGSGASSFLFSTEAAGTVASPVTGEAASTFAFSASATGTAGGATGTGASTFTFSTSLYGDVVGATGADLLGVVTITTVFGASTAASPYGVITITAPYAEVV